MAARRASALTLSALALALLALPSAFVPAPAGPCESRRGALALGTFGAAASSGVLPAAAEKSKDYFILPELPGPFEVDPKEAIIVGDAEAPQAKQARAKVESLLKEAETILAKLEEDPQADVSFAVQEFGIADLRVATNTINNLMDEATAAGTQRLQRLMIHNKYLYEDEIPFPVSKKGVVQKRGPARLARIQASLKKYAEYSRELLQFL
ncbi:unnamed protein product [Prorocentrum cordatum]|uniref:Uncharacterized protein n=1 Tax=Prorocentrum cordatum TaxID=2364126 RepID=A0ABN9PMH8_9DINO|nr:unnamed protein product [Polarella glacialis]